MTLVQALALEGCSKRKAAMRCGRASILAIAAILTGACENKEAREFCQSAMLSENGMLKANHQILIKTKLIDIYKSIPEIKAPIMDPAEYEVTFKSLGRKQFEKSNDLAKWAATYVVEKQLCKNLDIIMASDKSTPVSLEWFAICIGGAKIYVNETEAEATKKAALSGALASPPALRLYTEDDIDECVDNYDG